MSRRASRSRPSPSIVDVLLALLYPPRCPLCGRARGRAGGVRLCRACAASLRPPAAVCSRCGDARGECGVSLVCARCATDPPAFRRAWSCFVYLDGADAATAGAGGGHDGRRAIHAWKYRRDHVLGAALARHLVECRPFAGEGYDLFVPVPLHPARLRSRGFNQAAILAREVARGRGTFAPGVLRRSRATASQTALGRRARMENVRGAFTVSPRARLGGRSILLVDDVLTSGATASECTRVLLDAGARLVDVLSLARASSPRKRSG